MSILFTVFIAVGLLLGWSRDLSLQVFARQFLVWSCVLTSLVFGLFAEFLVAHWRFDGPRSVDERSLLGHIVTNWLLALGVSALALATLAMP